MGMYIYADTKTEALKKARKQLPKDKVVTSIKPTRNKGIYYAMTRKRRGY